MNLIREIVLNPVTVGVVEIILIVAALPMAGWSWAVNHMWWARRSKMQRRAHESTSVVPVQWSVSVVQELLGLQ